MPVFIVEEPGGETVPVFESVFVEAVVKEIVGCFLAGGDLLGKGHGFRGYDVNV